MVLLLLRVFCPSAFSCLTSLREVRQFENLMGTGEYRTFMERESPNALLHRYVHGDALIKHCFATGAIRKAVAGFFRKIRPAGNRSVSCTKLILNG
jgi:hypothetical protein